MHANPGPTSVRILNRARRGLRWLRRQARKAAGRPLDIHIDSRWRLGDEVLAIPFYHLVRRRHRGCRVTVAVNYPDLLAGNPDVEIVGDRSEFDCDLYLSIQDDGRSRPRLAHLCARHGIPHQPIEPTVRVPNVALPPQMPQGRPRIACSCGAGWACKSWIPAYMTEVVEALRQALPDAAFVELGRDCARAGVGVDLVDRLNIEQAAAVLAACDLYVGPDSGLVHLAMAVGTRAMGLYGPVRPDVAFGPRSRLLAILSPAPCHGCWTDGRMRRPGTCPLGIDSRQSDAYPCMNRITARQVLTAVRLADNLRSPS